MFFGGSPFEQFAGMHGGEGPGGPGGGRRGGPPADVDTTELYQILGIEKEASENDIKKAYRKLALKVGWLGGVVLCCLVCHSIRGNERLLRPSSSLETLDV